MSGFLSSPNCAAVTVRETRSVRAGGSTPFSPRCPWPVDKLIDLLAPGGIALIVLPGRESIEADLNDALSPDRDTTFVSEDLFAGLGRIGQTADVHSFTKWLDNDEMFDDDAPSDASLAFVAMRPIGELTAKEIATVTELLDARRGPRGVPLIWDIVVVETD
jgi:hypothetical protein